MAKGKVPQGPVKKAEKGHAGSQSELVTGGADLSKGFKSLGKYNPATDGSGPTSDTIHKGYRTATGGKAS